MKKMNLIFFGMPGVGKGTIAEKIAGKHNIPHISTGDIFREEMKNGSELGKLAASHINKGHLVPDDVTIKILKQRISKDDCRKGFVLDGFPRTIPQAEALDSTGIRTDKVINFTASEKIIFKRMASRVTCRKCGAVYNLETVKPKVKGRCDRCSGELYVREDQTREAVLERLEVYKKETEPLIDYYSKKGLLYTVNAENTVEKVLEDTEKVIS